MQPENNQLGFNRRKQSSLLPLRTPVQKTLLLCIASCCSFAQAQCYVDPVTKEQICTPASCSAHCRITVGDGSAGSGTLVRRSGSLGLVLTCAHLFDNATGRVIVSFTNGERFAARLMERDRAHDLAALLIRRPNAEPIAVSDEEPDGILSACGFGPDGQLHCFHGNVTGQATAAGAVHASLTIAGAARPGDSGGGVLNARGQLVGVVWGQRDGLTYATCGRPVREFLKRILGQSANHLPTPPADTHEQRDRQLPLEAIDSGLHARLESLEERLKQIAANKVGFLQGLSLGKLVVGALGLSGPVAAAVIIAGGLAGRRLKKRRRVDGNVDSTGRNRNLNRAPRPIPVDSPPPRQQAVPETHYVSIESDSFAKAHQWACEQVARKYPGATEILQAQDSLIKQYLSAH